MRRTVLSLLLLTGLLAGCARLADTTKKNVFEDAVICMEYPGNWRVTKNEELPGARLVYIEEPGDALVVITVYEKGQEVSLPTYAEAFVENLGDAVPFNLVKGSRLVGGDDALDIVFSIDLLGIKVPHTANLTLHVFEEGTVVCLTQVADEDRHLVQKGFALIRQSLRAAHPIPQGGR